jgi:hypothetical protein
MITTFVRLHLGAPRPHGATPSLRCCNHLCPWNLPRCCSRHDLSNLSGRTLLLQGHKSHPAYPTPHRLFLLLSPICTTSLGFTPNNSEAFNHQQKDSQNVTTLVTDAFSTLPVKIQLKPCMITSASQDFSNQMESCA